MHETTGVGPVSPLTSAEVGEGATWPTNQGNPEPMQLLNRVSQRQGRRGFSLVELLVVITIIAVLTAVVVFSIRGVSNNSKKAACQSNVATVQKASDAYYAQNGSYAASIDALVTANLLRSAPTATVPNDGYTVTYVSATGTVSSSVACSSL